MFNLILCSSRLLQKLLLCLKLLLRIWDPSVPRSFLRKKFSLYWPRRLLSFAQMFFRPKSSLCRVGRNRFPYARQQKDGEPNHFSGTDVNIEIPQWEFRPKNSNFIQLTMNDLDRLFNDTRESLNMF
jgi:hypothetical protein